LFGNGSKTVHSVASFNRHSVASIIELRSCTREILEASSEQNEGHNRWDLSATRNSCRSAWDNHRRPAALAAVPGDPLNYYICRNTKGVTLVSTREVSASSSQCRDYKGNCCRPGDCRKLAKLDKLESTVRNNDRHPNRDIMRQDVLSCQT
jgi:hypothetical protein